MARITAGVATSHVPAIGAALDLGKTGEPYWKPVFAGLRLGQAVDRRGQRPTSSSWSTTTTRPPSRLELIPTFAIGCAEDFAPADEGWGPRPVPVVEGHPTSPGTSRSR